MVGLHLHCIGGFKLAVLPGYSDPGQSDDFQIFISSAFIYETRSDVWCIFSVGLGGMGGRIVRDRVHSGAMATGIWDYTLRREDRGGSGWRCFPIRIRACKMYHRLGKLNRKGIAIRLLPFITSS